MAIFKADKRQPSTLMRLTDLDGWRLHAGPKDPSRQWKDYFSAKETARAWIAALPLLPPEVVTVLATHAAFGTVESWTAEPEAQLRFDSFGGARNSDLLVRAHDTHGALHIAVEAKAREAFGETIGAALTAAERRLKTISASKGVARVRALCRTYLDAEPTDDDVKDLRYQLLTATAGAVQQALREEVNRTVLLIHEFVRDGSGSAAHTKNMRDLETFIARLTRGSSVALPAGRLVEITLPDAVLVQRPLRLFVGKVTRILPDTPVAQNDGTRTSCDA
jgi:hypothetical protein